MRFDQRRAGALESRGPDPPHFTPNHKTWMVFAQQKLFRPLSWAYIAEKPASTGNVTPVTYRAFFSLASQMTALVTS